MTKAFDPKEFDLSLDDDEPEVKEGHLKRLKNDVAAFGTGGLDIAGGAVGFMGGLTSGVLDAAASSLGARPDKKNMTHALKKAGEWSEATMPSTYVDTWKNQRERTGYGAAMKPIETMTHALELPGKGVEEGAKLLGMGEEGAKNLGAGTTVSVMGGLPFVKGRAAKPGSRRAYQETADQKGGMSREDLRDNRLSYEQEPVKPFDANEFKQPPPDEFGPEWRPDQFTGPDDMLMSEARSVRNKQGPDLDALAMGDGPGGAMERETTLSNQARAAQRGLNTPEDLDYLSGRGTENPRQAPGPIDFEAPLDILNPLAAQKPGFQRSAEEVMRAREAEKGTNPSSPREETLELRPLLERSGLWEKYQKAEEDLWKTKDRYSAERFMGKIIDLEDEYRAKAGDPSVGPNARLPDNNFMDREFWNRGLKDVLEGNRGKDDVRVFAKKIFNIYTESKNPIRAGLGYIKGNSKTPYYRQLAAKLLEDESFKPDMEIRERKNVRSDKGDEVAGQYEIARHRINISEDGLGSEQLLLHEAVHARTYAALQAYNSARYGAWAAWNKLSTDAKWASKRINDLYEHLKGETEMRKAMNTVSADKQGGAKTNLVDMYGLTDVHEFVAEGMSNPAFQAQLAQLKIPKGAGGYSFYWDAFVDSIAKLMGFNRNSHTYLSELLRHVADLMTNTHDESRIHYADLMDDKKSLGSPRLDKKAVVPAVQEAAREFRLDRRPIEEVVEKELMGKKLEDFTPKDNNLIMQAMMRLGSLVKENLLQDTTLAQIMKDKPGTGPLIRWTVDQVSRIERTGMLKAKESLDTALKPFRNMYHNKDQRVELRQAIDKWFENIGVRDLTRADFTTDRQWEVYKNFQGVMDNILSDVNAMRIRAGLQEIKRIPSYFHSAWEGDYRVFGYKGDGTKSFAAGFSTEWQAKRAIKQLKGAHPDINFGEVEHIKKDRYGLNDLTAFEDAIRTMSAEDPVTKAVYKTYREILQHRGFGRTGVHKKGIEGFLGSEEGNKGLKMVEKSFDQYVNQAYRYTGNLEKQLVMSDLQKVPLKMRKEIPETFDFLYSYLRKTQGAKLDGMAIDAFLERISRAVGLGEGAPQRAVRGTSAIASMYWLTTPRFLFSQSVQSLNAIPKLIQQFGTVDGLKAYYEGVKGTISPDAITKEGAKWAGERGYLDATIVNVLSMNAQEAFGARPAGEFLQKAKQITSWPAAYIEHQFVRLPTFVAFEKALRPFIKDKEQRFQEAAEKTDYYMVNYQRAHSPLIYDKLGLAGEAARPLKQYSHNTWGQFFEYAKGLKDKGEVAPLVSFMGTQLAVAGVKGVILVAEATAVISMLNALFGTDIPTPEQLMLKWGVHDALLYGGLSYALQHDVSASVAAPSLPQMFSFPAIGFTSKMVMDVGGYLMKLAKGEETDQDRLKAAMALSPNAMHEFLKYIYTEKGGPTANPNDQQLRGNYRRSDNEWLASLVMSANPLDEAKVNAMMRNAKQELRRDLERRMDALDAMADQMLNGQPMDNKLIEKYMAQGGDPKNLSKSLVERIKNRSMTGPERAYDMKRLTPNQIHKLDTLRQYLDNDTPSSGQVDPESKAILPPRSDWGKVMATLASDDTYNKTMPDGYKFPPAILNDSNPPASWTQRVVPHTSTSDRMRTQPNPDFDRLEDKFRPQKDRMTWPPGRIARRIHT